MQLPADMEIPRMFPEFETMSSPYDQRQYLEVELAKLATVGKLILTHVINQRAPVCHLAKDVMTGSGISDGTDGHGKNRFHTDWPIHEAFETAKITIESTTDAPVSYTDGFEQVQGIVKSIGTRRYSQRQQRERVRDTGKVVAELPVRSAIIALDQHGAFVKYAPDEGMQKRYWKVIEAHPDLPWYPETRTGRGNGKGKGHGK